jgi:hypothetical protein
MKKILIVPCFVLSCLQEAQAQNYIISTYAGIGTGSFSGDGGPATAAELYAPDGVATDTAGNLYLTDYRNNRIRVVNKLGVISTIAGTGTFGCTGDGGPALLADLQFPTSVMPDKAGNLYLLEEGTNRVRTIDVTGTISTSVNSPRVFLVLPRKWKIGL